QARQPSRRGYRLCVSSGGLGTGLCVRGRGGDPARRRDRVWPETRDRRGLGGQYGLDTCAREGGNELRAHVSHESRRARRAPLWPLARVGGRLRAFQRRSTSSPITVPILPPWST